MVKITTNVIDVRAQLDTAATKQMPFALALALTRTAYNAKDYIRTSLPGILDRPTPWTLNALYVVAAKKDALFASIEYKQWASKGTPAGKVMEHHVTAGPRQRRPKRSEVLLRQKGVLKSNEFLVPSKYAQLNQYGNVASSKIMRMLSALQAVSYTAQNSANKKKRTAFFSTRRSGIVVIYERKGKNRIVPLFIGVDSPQYRALFNMEQYVERAYNRTFEYNLQAAMAQALATQK